MCIRVALASSLVLALLGCSDVDERSAERERGAVESDSLAREASPPSPAPQASPDVAAPPAANSPPAASSGADADMETADADIEIARRIREELVAGREQLSSEAQSVEVSVDQGAVTLRGPVENEREKELVVLIAGSVPGVTHVEDRLEIATR